MLLAFLVGAAGMSAQQTTPSEERPAFEVATVKPAPPGAMRILVTPPPVSPNRLYIPSMALSTLIYSAYGDGGFNTAMRVTGGPDWINQAAFAIEGVASAAATPRQFRLMLQRLLEERFALKIRIETTSVEMLTLVVARGDGGLGPKVKPWNGSCPKVMPLLYLQAPRRPLQKVENTFAVGPASDTDDAAMPYCPTGYRAGGMTLDGATMSTAAEVLSLPPGRALLGTIVANQTGVNGRYTMELDYPFPAWRPGDPAVPADAGLPSLATAIQEQWGLRIVPGRGPFKLVVVESAQLPTLD